MTCWSAQALALALVAAASTEPTSCGQTASAAAPARLARWALALVAAVPAVGNIMCFGGNCRY